jgi:hypothetical protein
VPWAAVRRQNADDHRWTRCSNSRLSPYSQSIVAKSTVVGHSRPYKDYFGFVGYFIEINCIHTFIIDNLTSIKNAK